MTGELLREFASYPALAGKLLRHKKVMKGAKVPYGGHRDQYLLYFAPVGEARDQVVVYIHGGGWDSGTPAMFSFVGQCFAQAGYHCLLPGYRKAPKYRFPAQLEDVRAGCEKGLRWLEEQGIGTEKVVVAGSSAGAHLGALLCYGQGPRTGGIAPDRLWGFAGLGGVYNFEAAPTWTQSHLLGRLFPRDCDRKAGEPVRMLAEGQRIPMLVIHGRGDGVVSWQNGVSFYEQARARNIPAEFYQAPPGADTHSVYTAGIFLEERKDCPVLDRLLSWMEAR